MGEMIKDLKAVILDSDGTLLDSIDAYYKIMKRVLEGVGLSVTKEKISRIMSLGASVWDALVPRDLNDRDEILNKCREDMIQIWPEMFTREAKIIPGSLRAVKGVKKSGMQTGIVTSSWEEALRPLKEEGILSLIDAVVTGPEISKQKPAPDSIIECLRRLETSAEYAVYVGDSPVDIIAGKAAGTRTIGVLTGTGSYETLSREEPDLIIETIDDLLPVLDL